MKKLSDELHSSCDEITNPTMMFTNQMIFEDIPQQATERKKSWLKKLIAPSLKIGMHLWKKCTKVGVSSQI